MQEYIEAKKRLDEVYRQGKKELADKVRPIFHQEFKTFFDQNPEVEYVSWVISSSIYDDESYNAGVENIRVRLLNRYTSEAFREETEGRYPYGWEDYNAALTWDEHLQDSITNLGSLERVTKLQQALDKIGYFVHRMDIDFLQNVFESNCQVTVTKDGFTVNDY